MLTLAITRLIESALNCYITLDPKIQTKQAELAGKVLGIHLIGFPVEIFFLFTAEKIYLQRACLSPADLMISAPPFTLLQLLQTEHPQSVLQQPNIHIQGDILLAQKIKAFFQSIHIPWEYYLSLLTGETVASQSGQFIKNNLKRFKRFSKELTSNISEYLQEEIQLTPPHTAIELFCQDVDTLRHEADLLAARLSRIKDQL